GAWPPAPGPWPPAPGPRPPAPGPRPLAPRLPAAKYRGPCDVQKSEQGMFACLHGSGNLTALAFEFSPTVERTAPDTVTLDASGLDRLFGLPQDVAAAIARRAAEVQVKAAVALAANPDAAICA